MSERLVTFPTWHQNTLRTNDNAFHTIATIPVPTGSTTAHGSTVAVRFVIVARCDDAYVEEGLTAFGQGGWVDNGGIATPLGSHIDTYTNSYNWSVQFTQSGSNILVQVNGDAAVNVSWFIRWAVDQVEEV
jgi:hypothetical protein